MSVVLLGDSILKRLFERYPDRFSSLSKVFCISGQASGELKVLVKANRDLLKGRTVVLHIGTNDFLKGVDSVTVRQTVRSLLRILRALDCEVRVLEIIPIGRWGTSAESQQRPFGNIIISYGRLFLQEY